MLITVDVGNTHTVFGLWTHQRLQEVCRLSTSPKRTAHEWAFLIQHWLATTENQFNNLKDNLAHASMIYSSVVPSVDNPLEESFSILNFNKIQSFNLNMKLPLSFDYLNPESLGKDRVVNSTAGIFFYGTNFIIVDFGTAITFCVTIASSYRGGVIAPGLQAGFDFLVSRTEKLPHLSWKQNVRVLGKSTEESILSGAHFGWEGLVSHILKSLKHEILTTGLLSTQDDLQIIATGGPTHNFFMNEQLFDVVDPNLTLRGLHKIFLINS